MKFYQYAKNDTNQKILTDLIEKYRTLSDARHQECNEYKNKQGTPNYTVAAHIELLCFAEETKEVTKQLKTLEDVINQQTPRLTLGTINLTKVIELTNLFDTMNDPELVAFLKEKFTLIESESYIDPRPNKIKFQAYSGGKKSESLLKDVLQHSAQKLFPYFNLTLARALQNAQFMPNPTSVPSTDLNKENATPLKMTL